METERQVTTQLCHDCRAKAGFVRKDRGCHTAQMKTCEGCRKEALVLPERHWKKV